MIHAAANIYVLLARTHDLRSFSEGFRSRSIEDNAVEVDAGRRR